ncbi:MAG TPA: VOC family protein [Cyclobacteriaceae bacterium]|nr:VOC family protein [Cyclobacteriaceae bacterium]
MKQLLTFLTIGVNDLDKMKNWYIQKFGWKPMKDESGIVFFKLNGFILALFPADELAKDIGVTPEGRGFKKFTLAINYHSEAEVDEAVASLKKKGVSVVKEPQKVFWGGYHAYIADPEDNYWELAFNPFLRMDKEGNVVSHD